mgnify:CR=1 FL=1
MVKWFKPGERFEMEALRLRDRSLVGELILIAPEWVLLEVTRGLAKAGYKEKASLEAWSSLTDMARVGVLSLLRVSELLQEARDAVIKIRLYASDAVALASAIRSQTPLVTDDRHLLNESVKKYALARSTEILRLSEALK